MDIQELLDRAMPKIAVRLQNELILTAPVLTGRLRNSIKVAVTNEGLTIFLVDYAIFVEFGTFKQRPNPFIRTVLYTKLAKIIQEEIIRAS